MRITPTVLNDAIKAANIALIESGSNIYFEHGQRNGYQALDFGYIDQNGNEFYYGYLECGTSKECLNKLETEKHSNYGKIWRDMKVNKAMTKGVLKQVIDFNLTPCQLSNSQRADLETWRKLCGYNYKPLNYSKVTGFYLSLKRVK